MLENSMYSKSHELQETRPVKAEGNLHPSRKYTSGRFIDYWSGLVRLITRISVRHESDEIVSAHSNVGISVQSLRWNGSSITVDQYAPAGYIFGLN